MNLINYNVYSRFADRRGAVEVYDLAAFFVILALVVGGAMFANHISAQNAKHRRRQTYLDKEPFRQAKRSFLESQKDEWPYSSGGVDGSDFMMMSRDSLRRRFVSMRSSRGLVEVFDDQTIPVRNVVNVELKQDTETVTSIDVTTATKKDGALARAAIGGLAFGGAGAVVSAVSAGSTSHASGSHTSKTKVLANRIVIGTSNPDNPTIVRRFSSSSEAVDWYHRVLGAIAAVVAN